MSTLQVANVWLESTANNRIQYAGSNTYNLVAGSVNALTVNSIAVTIGNPITLIANGVSGINQVLSANTTGGLYWGAGGAGGATNAITQITVGNGLTGSPSTITSTGSISVNPGSGIISNSTGTYVFANSGLVANATGLHVLAGSGIVSNSTGTHVNTSYIATLAANSAAFLGSAPAGVHVNTSYDFALAGKLTFNANSTFNANILIGSAGVSANSSYGNAFDVLTANGTGGVYWRAISSTGSVLSVSNATNITMSGTGSGSGPYTGAITVGLAATPSVTGLSATANILTANSTGGKVGITTGPYLTRTSDGYKILQFGDGSSGPGSGSIWNDNQTQPMMQAAIGANYVTGYGGLTALVLWQGQSTGSACTTVGALDAGYFKLGDKITLKIPTANSTGSSNSTSAPNMYIGADGQVYRSTNTVVTTSDSGTITNLMIASGTITNSVISACASISYSKLNLFASITNTDISTTAGISPLKLSLATSACTSVFLRGDGTWQTPPGSGPGAVSSGATNQIAYYSSSGTTVSPAPVYISTSNGNVGMGGMTGATISKQLVISNSSNYGAIQLGDDTNGVYIIKESSTAINNPGMFHISKGPSTSPSLLFSINTSGALGIGPAYNVSYGSTNQILTSQGAGAPPSWSNFSVTNSLTFNNSGTGSASGATFNGGSAVTISYNSIGASPLAGSGSLTTLGTISSGTWNGTAIGVTYGGTGKSVYTVGDLLYAGTTTSLSALTMVTANSVLISGGVGNAPSWSATIPSSTLGGSSLFIGTTSVALNRTSGALALSGITSVTLPGATSGSVQIIPTAIACTTILTLPATTGTLITTNDTGTVSNSMLAGSISPSKLSGYPTSTNVYLRGDGTWAAPPGATGSGVSGVSNSVNITMSGTGSGSGPFTGSVAVGLAATTSVTGLSATADILSANSTGGKVGLTAGPYLTRDSSGYKILQFGDGSSGPGSGSIWNDSQTQPMMQASIGTNYVACTSVTAIVLWQGQSTGSSGSDAGYFKLGDKISFKAPGVYSGTTTNFAPNMYVASDGQVLRSTAPIYASSSGYVGIGASIPRRKLEVSSSVSNEARIRVSSTTSVVGNFRGYELANSALLAGFTGGLFQEESTNDISIWTSGGPRFIISDAGNVGINTIAGPIKSRLTVNGTIEVSLSGSGVKFADGTTQYTAAAGTTVKAVSGSYTISASDNLSTLEAAAGTTITLPSGISAVKIDIVQTGTGTVTITAGSGSTLNTRVATGSVILSAQYAGCTVYNYSGGTQAVWVAVGDIAGT